MPADYKLPQPFFVLAPMDDVTDTVFRQVIAACAAPDMAFTEFVNVDGLQSEGRRQLLKKLRFDANEPALVAQLWGLNPQNFRKTAAEIADGSLARELRLPPGVNFAGVDLNMGCPAKSEVKNGTCSALILNRPLAGDIIAATQDGLAGRLPLSVKTRVGFHEVDMSWIAFLLKHNLAMLTVHGRTRRQMSRVPADWSLIARARELRDQIAPMTLIVGNGDVMNRQHGESLAARHGLDGIMIGRGIFQNPFAFSKKSDNTWQDYDERMRTALFRKQIELFGVTWQHNERPLKTLNKFCKIYINGFEGAKELREELMSAHSTTELLNYLQPQLARR